MAGQSFVGRVVREPLLHFALVGALLFAVDAQRRRGRDERIVLPRDFVEALRQEGAVAGVSPRDALHARVERWIDDEVLYREAMALGLDKGDPIVRRRLIQKMELAIEDARPIEPTDAELEAYQKAHAARYALPTRIAFDQVFFSIDRGAEAAKSAAESARATILSGGDWTKLGDPSTSGQSIPMQGVDALAGTHGAPFAAAVAGAKKGEWSLPLVSKHGVHLVRPMNVEGARDPALSEVRSRVLGDLVDERRAEAKRTAMTKLRARYAVKVEWPAGTQ